jgi:c-di-GMP-binding flagellar brake protein YcgR
MDERPWALLLDDGELDDVRQLLDALGVDYEEWSKSDLSANLPHPRTLLVTTSGHAIAARLRREPGRIASRAVWIAVATGTSKTQHTAIFGAGFDYLVRRPVHPEALRLLLRAALYQGREQRSKRRLAAGSEISYRIAGRGTRKALLVDISPGGCRLLARCKPNPGVQLSLRFPRELLGGAELTHEGMVTRAVASGDGAGEFFVGVRFLPFEAEQREPILRLLNGLASGPAVLPEPLAELARPAALNLREARGVFDSEVPICGLDGCVLVGRDLSVGGMRVDPQPALQLGATLRLAIGLAADTDPVEVEARVARDDGENGVVVHFDWIEPGGKQRLRKMIASLPPIEARAPKSKKRGGVFLTSVIPKLLRRRS